MVNPDILVIEYNSIFGSSRSVTLKYNENFIRPNRGIYKCLYGASLSALTKLSEKKGYSLVATNLNGNNAFYVRNQLLNEKVYKKDHQVCFKQNSFKEFLDEKGELKYLDENNIKELLNNENLVEV